MREEFVGTPACMFAKLMALKATAKSILSWEQKLAFVIHHLDGAWQETPNVNTTVYLYRADALLVCRLFSDGLDLRCTTGCGVVKKI